MRATELNDFYQQGYRSLYQETEEPTKKDLIMQKERANKTLEMIREDVTRVDRHLDIGSSSGALLGATEEYFGCEGIGVEPGDEYRSFSIRLGYKAYPSIDILPADTDLFDLISIMHVLEHFPDPVGSLRELREGYLNPHGFLLVEVPNLLEHEALEIAHLFAFTPSTLKETVRQAGFEPLWTKTHGSFRSPILNLYITLLAVPSDDPPGFEHIRSRPTGIKVRRNWGKLKSKLLTRFLPDWTWQSPSSLWEE
jgi:SAM-dependent methyltransferase